MSFYDIVCLGYCSLHKVAKSVLSRKKPSFRMVDIAPQDVPSGELGQYYPVENIIYADALLGKLSFKDHFPVSPLGLSNNDAELAWKSFITAASIPAGYKNTGLCYAGYINRLGWCLPSWIWTNAALVRMYCSRKCIDKARALADKLLTLQDTCGGWIVRNDYGERDVIPVLAPNDSSYLANNAMLAMYQATGESKYLNSAVRCAEWIMSVARTDGMVPVGFDVRRQVWQKHNIVDTGFTAALFSNLFNYTGAIQYREFLARFVSAYIKLFYNPKLRGFATSLDDEDRQLGGQFARGQAWALEGLIPAYLILKDDAIREVIDNTIRTLLRTQRSDGGWAYNLTRPLMGEDCKGIPVIAKALLDWNTISPDVALISSARKALRWCCEHTALEGPSRGGIFSFCMEGAVVHHLYTATAFVYASAYALEVHSMLNND